MTPIEAGSDVGRLLAFALDVTASPGASGASADYARLVERYREDATFRSLFDSVIEGVGCEVTTADSGVGLVLRTRADGPWAWPARTADLPWNKSFEDPHLKAARALVVLAILAYVSPSAADLDDILGDPAVLVTTIRVRDLEQFIRDFCAQHEARSTDPVADESTRPLWWHWMQLPAEAPTAKRISRRTTTYIVHDVLSFLALTGWLIDKTSSKAGADKVYQPRRRFLHHYRDLLLDEVFTALREHAQEQGRPTAAATETGG